MSINVEGVPAPVPTDVTPPPATLGFTTATHLISASSFINTDVTATAPSLSFTPVNASANNNVNVNNTLPSLTFSGLNHTIVGSPELSNTDVTASAPTLSINPAGSAIVAVDAPSSFQWLKGVGSLNAATKYPLWKAWIGRDAEIFMEYSAQSEVATWADFRTGNNSPKWQDALDNIPVIHPDTGNKIILIHSWPMVPQSASNARGANSSLWANYAGGSYDADVTASANSMAQDLFDAGRDENGSDLIIRFGWEMNGEWYPWAVCGTSDAQSDTNITNYKAAWNRATALYKTVMPDVRFDWSPGMPRAGFYWSGSRNYSQAGNGLTLLAFMPSDNVDFISRSTHDDYPVTTSEQSFYNNHIDPLNSGQGKKYGLQELADAATSRGIQFGLSEWATQIDATTSWDEAPNPDIFIQEVWDFLFANESIVAFDTYFSPSFTQLYDRGPGEGSTYNKGLDAQAKYFSLWETP